MNKKVIAAVGVVIVLIGAGLVLVNKKDNSSTSSSNESTSSSSSKYKIVNACEVFTLADAQAVLGSSAQAGTSDGSATESDDISVSTCTYTAPGIAATLLARSAKTADGTTSNNGQFATLPSTGTDVQGYGDKAYWDSAYGQLNILKNNNWYILSNGPIRAENNTVESAKKLADQIISRL